LITVWETQPFDEDPKLIIAKFMVVDGLYKVLTISHAFRKGLIRR
jgi:hypothetical protein